MVGAMKEVANMLGFQLNDALSNLNKAFNGAVAFECRLRINGSCWNLKVFGLPLRSITSKQNRLLVNMNWYIFFQHAI